MGEGTKVIIGERFRSKSHSTFPPGPGAYNPNKDLILEKKASIGIGYGNRMGVKSDPKAKNPGPGAYTTVEDNITGGFTFGKSLRNNKDKMNTPGPGRYEFTSTVSDLPGYEKAKMKH